MAGPLANYLDTTNMISVAATPNNSGPNYPDDVEHTLRSYYLSVDNLDVLGVHRGNAIDVYVHDPKSILSGSTTVTIPGPDLYTKNIVGVSQYIQQITGIEDAITGELIDPTLYSIALVKKGDSFSKEANYKISFDIDDITGAEINFLYENGATFVDLNIGLTVARYTTIYEKFTTIVAVSDSFYKIPDNSLARFFTTTGNLGGIERV
jgi:hypothetical protein